MSKLSITDEDGIEREFSGTITRYEEHIDTIEDTQLDGYINYLRTGKGTLTITMQYASGTHDPLPTEKGEPDE